MLKFTQEEFMDCIQRVKPDVDKHLLPGMAAIVIVLCEEDDGSITHITLSGVKPFAIPSVLRLCANEAERRVTNANSTPLEEEADG